MTKYRAAIENMVSVIKGTTPDTLYAGNKSFRHEPRRVSIEALMDGSNPTRKFVVASAGGYELGGPQKQASEPGEVTEIHTVSIAYGQTDNPYEVAIVMREDLDRLVHRLRLTSLFDRDNGTLLRRSVVDHDITLAEAAGGTAVLTLDVTHTYRPEFS